MTVLKSRVQAKADDPAKSCACGPGRKAVSVDPEVKAATLRRLARIEGQVRGLAKMVESERYWMMCVQFGSVQQALRGVSRQLMRNHLKNCATDAIRKGSTQAEEMYDELLDLVFLHTR